MNNKSQNLAFAGSFSLRFAFDPYGLKVNYSKNKHSIPKRDFTDEFSVFFIIKYYNFFIASRRQGTINVSIT